MNRPKETNQPRSERHNRHNRHDQRAFSLPEMLVTVGVLGILTAIFMPVFTRVNTNSKIVIAQEMAENLNLSLKKHAQVNYEFVLPKDPDDSADELAILRSLQWRDPADPATGSPFVRPNWNPVGSDDADTYRLEWNGRVFVLLEPGDAGSGLKVDFEATDYGGNYNFPADFSPVGG